MRTGEHDTVAIRALAELDAALEQLTVVQETLQSASAHERQVGIAATRLLETTLDGRILAASPRAAETLNAAPQLLMRKPITTFVPTADRQVFRWRLARLARGETDRDRWVQTLVPREQPARKFDVAVFRTREADTSRLVWLLHTGGDGDGSTPTTIDFHSHDSDGGANEAPDATTIDEQFLMTVVHELRTPINAISSYLSLLRNETIDDAVKARAFDVIERNTALQAQLISDLADRAHLMSGHVPLRLRSLDLRDVAAQAVDSVKRLAEAAKLNLQLTLPADAVLVNADEARLQQVAGNLLTNAIKYTPSGGRVFVEVAGEHGKALLRVEDSGNGIGDAFHKRLFGRFEQDGRTAPLSKGGFGLGLWIVRQLVEAHGGSVSATSGGEGRGTRLTVELALIEA